MLERTEINRPVRLRKVLTSEEAGALQVLADTHQAIHGEAVSHAEYLKYCIQLPTEEEFLNALHLARLLMETGRLGKHGQEIVINAMASVKFSYTAAS